MSSNVITYENIKLLQSRNDYIQLEYKEESSKIDEQIAANVPLAFLPTYLQEITVSENRQKGKYKILLHGILKDGRRATVLLDDIEPYFEVRCTHPYNEGNNEGNNDNRSDIDNFEDKIKSKLNSLENSYIKFERIIAKPFKLYQKHKNIFLRFYFNKTKDRSAALKLMHNEHYETATDDGANYYRIVCRDMQTTFCNWAELTKYRLYTIDGIDESSSINFRVRYTNYKSIPDSQITMDMRKDKSLSCCWDIETWGPSGDVPQPENKEDGIFCIGMTFQFVNEKHPFKRICLVEYPANNINEQKNEENIGDITTIICRNEKNLIKAFAKIINKMKPEFIFGFNDGEYDWNWIIERAKTYSLLPYLESKMNRYRPSWQNNTDSSYISTNNCKRECIKIDATTNANPLSLAFHGYYAIDVRVVYRKIFPNDEQSSLKHFLEKCKLSGKDYMPYDLLHNIYKDYRNFALTHAFTNDNLNLKISPDELETYLKLKNQLADVNKYCIVDAVRCHDLIQAKKVILDARELGNMAFTSMFDALYRANGLKVRNLTIAIGQREPFNIRFSNIGVKNGQIEEGKYPGAYVYPPKKGLKTTKLSIIERIRKAKETQHDKLTLMQEWLNTTDEEIKTYYDYIDKHGINDNLNDNHNDNLNDNHNDNLNDSELKSMPKHFIDFIKETNGRPIIGLDFASLYPSLIRTYNFSPEYCVKDAKLAKELSKMHELTKVKFAFNGRDRKAYFISHDGHIDLDKDKEKFKFGVIPYVLDGIFRKRKLVKKELGKVKEQLEHLDANGKSNTDEYENLKFRRDYINSNQNALKVFMNTFYGECGNKISPFFILELAGGITTYGVMNIKDAQDYVTSLGCIVYYGDTDSIYLSVPEKYFYEIDKEYYTGKINKLTYWTKLVEITFKQSDIIKDQVNKRFIERTKTEFLQMAYEEVLFPSNFMAKKKYYGIPHEGIVNFKPKDLFIRGVSVKVRGVSMLLKIVFEELMRATVDPDNIYTVMELVIRKINFIYNTKWGPDLFVQSDVYKPNKKNIKVQTFVQRMKDRDIYIKPHERYQYVYVKRYPYTYDHRGRKKPITAGHRIELVNTMQKENLKIDLDHYMQGSINGLFARFITYHNDFQISMRDIHDVEELKIVEKKIYNNACKYIENYCCQFYTVYDSYGDVMKETFKTVNNVMKTIINKNITHIGAGETIGDILTSNVDLDAFVDWVCTSSCKKAEKLISKMNYGKTIIEDMLDGLNKKHRNNKIVELQKTYYSRETAKYNKLKYIKTLEVIRNEKHEITIINLKKDLSNHIDEYKDIFMRYHGKLQVIIDNVKADISTGVNLDDGYSMANNSKTNLIKKEDIEFKAESTANKLAGNLLDTKYISMLNKFKQLYNWFIIEYLYHYKNKAIVDYLKYLGAKITKNYEPDKNELNEIIKHNKLHMTIIDL